jgi:hypothetical protein
LKGPAHAIEHTTPLPCEYANYKNLLGIFSTPHDLLIQTMERTMSDDASKKPLPDAARRALAEAEARRQAAAASAKAAPKEFHGPKGPEPTRYGDWENKGIASDF